MIFINSNLNIIQFISSILLKIADFVISTSLLPIPLHIPIPKLNDFFGLFEYFLIQNMSMSGNNK